MKVPVLFSFAEELILKKETIQVEFTGRFLVTEQEEDVWVLGVTPGGIAARGETFVSALSSFKTTLIGALLDISEEYGKDPEKIEDFIKDEDSIEEKEWIKVKGEYGSLFINLSDFIANDESSGIIYYNWKEGG